MDSEPSSWERTTPGGNILEVSTSPTPDGGFVNIVTDITERKRAEDALHEQTKTVQLLHKTASDANQAGNVEGKHCNIASTPSAPIPAGLWGMSMCRRLRAPAN